MGFNIGMLGAAFQGQQDYANWEIAQKQKQQQMQFEALRMKAMQDAMAQQAQDQQRQKNIARGYVGMLSNNQSPAPGQPSVPMQPPAASRPLPPGQAGPVLPPYKSMNSVQPAPQGMPMIPEAPKYDWNTAIQRVKAQGIQDPEAILAILDKNQARLDVEARSRLAQAKEQFNEEFRMAQLKQGDERLKNQERNTDSLISKRNRTGSGAGGGLGGGTGANDAVDAMAWAWLINGQQPPKRNGTYERVSGYITKLAKENGFNSAADLMGASADVKTKLQAKKAFETRSQNMKRAENQLESEIPVFEDLVKKINAPSTPMLAKLTLAARRQMGDADVTQMDQAADVIFREFEGIATGNPGTLNVQDVQNAHQAYLAAQTPQQAQAAITGMRRIIKNAQGAMDKTRKEIMGDVMNEVNPSRGGPKIGTVQDGYRYKGGNPADKNSWEKAQ